MGAAALGSPKQNRCSYFFLPRSCRGHAARVYAIVNCKEASSGATIRQHDAMESQSRATFPTTWRGSHKRARACVRGWGEGRLRGEFAAPPLPLPRLFRGFAVILPWFCRCLAAALPRFSAPPTQEGSGQRRPHMPKGLPRFCRGQSGLPRPCRAGAGVAGGRGEPGF